MKLNFIIPEIDEIDQKEMQPASYIRKEFTIAAKVRKATLYMTALGVYKGYLNGQPLQQAYLLPGFTYYHKRLQYQTWDVTDQLHTGVNTLSAIVGDGWYRGALGSQSGRNGFGSKIALAARLEIETERETVVIETDPTWKATQNGPLRRCDIKTYETIDFTKEMPGWNESGFQENGWHACQQGAYSGQLVPHEGGYSVEHEVFAPKVLHTPNGETILDFGQNHAGHVAFSVTGPHGHKAALYMGETLDETGNFTVKNICDEKNPMIGDLGQCLELICDGSRQEYKSHFLVSGYRYVKLENWPEPVVAENFRSIAIYNDFEIAGSFACSDYRINRLYKNILWSMKSNFVDIPTDCPTRERAGWTGDINVFCESALYISHTKDFLRKYLKDLMAMQLPNGALPGIAPGSEIKGNFSYGVAGWSDVIVNLPMTLYRFDGDTEILEVCYDAAKKHVDRNLKRAERKHLFHLFKTGEHYKYIFDTGFHYGEWLEPGTDMMKTALKAMICADAEVATAWLYHSVKQLAQMGALLGKREAAEYMDLSKKIKGAYQKEFLRDGMVNSDRQCRYVRPLYMGLIPRENRQAVANQLAQMCRENDYRIGTGFLTTHRLLQTLCDHGHSDTAYKILLNEKCPGWMYEISKGATTIWENWLGVDEKGVPKDSHNHYSPGAIAAWFYSHCAGIRPVEPGFRKIRIQPVPGGGLQWAEASYQSVHGKIASRWEMAEGHFTLNVDIPKGVEAQIILPDGKTYAVNAGKHWFETNWTASQ